MKTRTAFPLLYALSFLMVTVSNSSAQLNPAYPYSVAFSLDSASITNDLNKTTITTDTVRGSIQDNSHYGNFKVTVNLAQGTQWITQTKIGGSVVQDGDIMQIGQGEIFPVEVLVSPYADRPDTESYCLTLSISPTYIVAHNCIKLVNMISKSTVSTDPLVPKVTLVPNPAGSYILVKGLTDASAGYRYEIFSIRGAEVRHGMLPGNARINIQDIPSGAYRLLLFDVKRMLSNTAITVLH